MTLRRRVVAIFGAALAAILAGCQDPHAGKVRLRYMAWGNVQQLALEERMVELFNRQNPDLHVELFKVPQSAYANKAVVMFASRTAPDVVRIDHYNFAQLAERDYFLDLGPLAKADPDFDESDFFPLAMQENRHKGRLLGLNALFGGAIMIYNKTLLRNEGLEDPFALSQRGEWTTERLLDYAKRLTKFDPGGRPVQFGINHPGMPFYIGLMYGFGGQLLDDDLKGSALDRPETIAALQYISDLRWKHRVCPSPSQGANAAFAFETGRLAMEFNYVGATARYREMIRDFEWDICPFPRGPKAKSLFVKGNQLVIYKESRHPKEAWRLLRFLTGEEAETILYLEERRQSPTRIALARSRRFTHPDQPPYNMAAVAETVQEGKVLPIDERWPEVMQAVGPELENLFAGRERDARKAALRAHAAVEKVLNEEPGL